MAERLLRGEDYPELCAKCRKAIDSVADELEARREMGEESIISGRVSVDIMDDEEAANMVAYDRGMLCTA